MNWGKILEDFPPFSLSSSSNSPLLSLPNSQTDPYAYCFYSSNFKAVQTVDSYIEFVLLFFFPEIETDIFSRKKRGNTTLEISESSLYIFCIHQQFIYFFWYFSVIMFWVKIHYLFQAYTFSFISNRHPPQAVMYDDKKKLRVNRKLQLL